MNKVIRRLKKIMGGFEGEAEPILKEGQKEVKEKVVKPKPTKAKEVVEEKVEEPKLPTTDEVLVNHEQRILQMEAKWFRLGGI